MLTTFLAVVDAKLPINLTCSLAFAQNLLGNFILYLISYLHRIKGSNAFRPSDIIKSLKGLTVDIGNTGNTNHFLIITNY
jgi:leucyl aminopeptidase